MTVAEVGGLHRHLLLSARRAKAAPLQSLFPAPEQDVSYVDLLEINGEALHLFQGGRANEATLVVH